MKKLILIPILLGALFVSAASFPVFIGNTSNYISNDVANSTWYFVVNNERVGYFNESGITITNNNGLTFAKTNGSTVTMISFEVSGVQTYRLTVSSNVLTIVDAVNSDTVLQYDLSKRIMTIANAAVSYKTDTGASTNSGSSFFKSDVTVKGWAKTIQTISGTGGANTNFTLQSTQAMVFFDLGTTNASLTIMGGDTTRAFEGAFVGTNRTGTDRTLAFSAVSNNWRSVTHYDGVSTNGETLTCTNGTAIAGWFRIIGSNVLVALKHISLPAP